MRMSYVLLAVVAIGCGGGGGDSAPTSPNPTYHCTNHPGMEGTVNVQ